MARVRGRRWRLYHPPQHLHYFSRDTLSRLLRRHGLEPIDVAYVGFSRSIDTMLYRLLADRRNGIGPALYRLARGTGLTGWPVYVNLRDIMFVAARKMPGKPSAQLPPG